VLAFQNPGSYTTTNLSLNGQQILADPGTPPVSTYSVGVNLVAGQTYTLQLNGGGPSANLSWATPSELAPGIAQAVAAAKSAKTAVVVVSDDTESEAADRAGLNLPSAQNELISAVAAANPHTVVVVDAGAPVVMPWLNQVAAVVDAWYPGESNGTALAAVLYGKVDPSGHLPVTFPTDLSQVPCVEPEPVPRGQRSGRLLGRDRRRLPLLRRRQRDAAVPLRLRPVLHQVLLQRPAGHSRSGAEQHLEPRVRPAATATDESSNQVTVSAKVTNTGKVTGSDVAQVYLGDPSSAGEPPRQLKGFQKVTLKPGQSTTVHFTLNGEDLSYYDDAANGWVLPDGGFSVEVGDSSATANLPLQAASP
jgi:beta-glucosidase